MPPLCGAVVLCAVAAWARWAGSEHGTGGAAADGERGKRRGDQGEDGSGAHVSSPFRLAAGCSGPFAMRGCASGGRRGQRAYYPFAGPARNWVRCTYVTADIGACG